MSKKGKHMANLPPYIASLPVSQQVIWRKCLPAEGAYIEFRKEEIEQSISERFEQQVWLYPARLAVKTKKYELTYTELNQTANRIAHAILERCGVGSESVVVLLDKDALFLAAILAVLKAGKFYVPLDPFNPRVRLATMMEDLQTHVMVTNSAQKALAQVLAPAGCHILNVEELDASLSTTNPDLTLSPDTLACILYTSGSTGSPKGVMQNHRNILHGIMRHTNILPICPDDRLTLLSSIGFVGAVRDTFSALLNGAALFPFDLHKEGIEELANWLRQEEITMYRSVATVFRHFVHTLRGNEVFPKLRAIKLGSETLYQSDVELYKRHFSENCILYIGMGTTETGTIAHYLIDKDTSITSQTIPAGYAVADMEILILDEEGNPLESETVGEIAVKSRYLSLGYWRSSSFTQERFLPDPYDSDTRIYRTGDVGYLLPDGCLIHLGRKDFQVKVRGYRVNIAEIERVLLDYALIKAAAVIAREDRFGVQQLVAYIVPAENQIPKENELRHFIQERLPAYMLPAAFVLLDTLPLTPTGKVDRQALPVPQKLRPELDTPFVAPRTPLEETLAALWAEALGLDQVGIHDHFLELGGHSLLATQIITQIIHTFRIDLPVRSLFEAPTIAAMALLITQYQTQQAGSEEMARMLAEIETLSEEQAQTHLSQLKEGIVRKEWEDSITL